MTKEELLRELAEYADRSVDGPVLKGLPRKGNHPGDGELEERDVARLVLKHLGLTIHSLKSEPCGTGTIPDVEAVLANGEHIGIEVTELVDEKVRHQNNKRRDEERKLGLTQSEAFKLELQGNNPTPGQISRFVSTEWCANRLYVELDHNITKKDRKAEKHQRNGINWSQYSEMVLAIFTGNEVSADKVAAAKRYGPLRSRHFQRIAVVLDYDPQVQDYPVLIL